MNTLQKSLIMWLSFILYCMKTMPKCQIMILQFHLYYCKWRHSKNAKNCSVITVSLILQFMKTLPKRQIMLLQYHWYYSIWRHCQSAESMYFLLSNFINKFIFTNFCFYLVYSKCYACVSKSILSFVLLFYRTHTGLSTTVQ